MHCRASRQWHPVSLEYAAGGFDLSTEVSCFIRIYSIVFKDERGRKHEFIQPKRPEGFYTD